MLLVALALFGALWHLAPAIGREVFIVRSGSMEPSIPVGSVIIVSAVRPERLRTGEVVTIEAPAGVVITHRILSVEEVNGERHFQLKGDANPSPDPALVPVSWLVGRLTVAIPLLGYFLAYLSTPFGIMAALAMAGSIVTASWVLEDVESYRRAVARERPDGVPA